MANFPFDAISFQEVAAVSAAASVMFYGIRRLYQVKITSYRKRTKEIAFANATLRKFYSAGAVVMDSGIAELADVVDFLDGTICCERSSIELIRMFAREHTMVHSEAAVEREAELSKELAALEQDDAEVVCALKDCISAALVYVFQAYPKAREECLSPAILERVGQVEAERFPIGLLGLRNLASSTRLAESC